MRNASMPAVSLPAAMFDLNSDSYIDLEDHRIWVKDIKHTWYGDADLDGEFNSSDLCTSSWRVSTKPRKKQVGPKATGTAAVCSTHLTS